ncbi:hypothetical protein [uncultured Gilliamella sp.]|uniref:hypothetical protein n=1 Tax=uncultured Gilliamella sp. TaxID=1193505 RepID=UPI0025CC5B11|nr:hypothetical protein [uncultured Gilliamella sp.]
MNTVNYDYYKSFEGEGEINIIRIRKNGDKIILKIWQGYFDLLLDAILNGTEFKDPTELKGILKCYYYLSDFYDYEPYFIDNIALEIDNLIKFNVNKISNKKQLKSDLLLTPIIEIKENILTLLNEALAMGDEVYIKLV